MRAKRLAKEVGAPLRELREKARKMRASDCRKLMRETLAAEYREILGAFVKVAKKGSAAHMKLATELLEKKAEVVARRRGGSAARLLRELKERDRLG